MRRLCVLLLMAALCTGFEWPGRVDRLVREVKQGDVETRKLAVRQLGQHPASVSETAILAALEDDDVGVRIEAAQAAGQAGVHKAAAILTDWLHDSDVATRRAAVAGLGDLAEARALSDIVRALGDVSVEVRAAAVGALRALGSAEAVAPLLGRLQDTDLGVRGLAIDALGALKDERAVVPLLTQLQDPSSDLATRAAAALATIGDARAVPTLIQALQNRPLETRIAAAAALGRMRAGAALPALDLAAGDTELRLARAALDALARIDDAGTRTALIAKLGSATLSETASQALVAQAERLRALGAAADAELTKLLQALAAQAQPTTSPTARTASIAAARTLARIGAFAPLDAVVGTLTASLGSAPLELAVPLLDALATSSAEAARVALLERLGSAPTDQHAAVLDALERQLALGEPDGRAADPLLAQLASAHQDDQARLLRLLGATGAERSASAVAPFLTASQPALRAASARALGQVKAFGQAGAVLALLDDDDADVRRQAAIALRAIGNAETTTAMLERLTSTEAADRHALLIALGGSLHRLTREKALPAATSKLALATLNTLSGDADAGIADRALAALGNWGPKAALSLLGHALRTPSSRKRAVIATALMRLGDPDARIALRYVLDQGGERSAVAAINALAEIGDERDLAALLRTAQRKHWPLPAAATYAVARLSLRGVLKPHLAKRALCDLGRGRDPYVRANVAAALAVSGASACEDGGPDPLRWLAKAKAPAVRVAAARWLHAALAAQRVEPALALAALDECARTDGDAGVRAACVAPAPLKSSSALTAQLREATDATLSNRLVALRTASGAVFIGYADHNGEVFLPATADGPVALEDPASSVLEPRD